MTIEYAVEYADRIKPNNFDNDDMIRWINEVEALIQTKILLIDINDVIQYGSWNEDKNTELIIPPPHDKVYTTYLLAEIDNANGEYNRYANTKLQFDAAFAELARWVSQTYAPANRHLNNRIKGREANIHGLL